MDKYAEYLDDADDSSGESTTMMREAMDHTQVRRYSIEYIDDFNGGVVYFVVVGLAA